MSKNPFQNNEDWLSAFIQETPEFKDFGKSSYKNFRNLQKIKIRESAGQVDNRFVRFVSLFTTHALTSVITAVVCLGGVATFVTAEKIAPQEYKPSEVVQKVINSFGGKSQAVLDYEKSNTSSSAILSSSTVSSSTISSMISSIVSSSSITSSSVIVRSSSNTTTGSSSSIQAKSSSSIISSSSFANEDEKRKALGFVNFEENWVKAYTDKENRKTVEVYSSDKSKLLYFCQMDNPQSIYFKFCMSSFVVSSSSSISSVSSTGSSQISSKV